MEFCKYIVFSDRAYNAIIRESFTKDPVETGGVLLGHMTDSGVWIVMEVLPPGPKSTFEIAFCQYDNEFVNYLYDSVAQQYHFPLSVLGQWHRHPDGYEHFSGTDDIANTSYARLSPAGAISGLVHIDPNFRLNMYHLCLEEGVQPNGRPIYHPISFEVGDDLIPDEYFQMRYIKGPDSNLNPPIPDKIDGTNSVLSEQSNEELSNLNMSDIVAQQIDTSSNEETLPMFSNWVESLKKNKIYIFLIVITLVSLIVIIKSYSRLFLKGL